jgi:hypothetical protein
MAVAVMAADFDEITHRLAAPPWVGDHGEISEGRY